MRIPAPVLQSPRWSDDAGFGLSHALPSIGATQRACLGRGLSFVLILTLACIALVYAPLIGRADDRPGAGTVIRLSR